MTSIDTDAHPALLAAARTAHGQRDWHASYDAFTRATEIAPLATHDLDAFASAAWRSGHGNEAVCAAEQVFGQLVLSDPGAAAMKAVDLGRDWANRGDLNIAQGWMNRARRLLDGIPEGPAHGYLAYVEVFVAIHTADAARLIEGVGTLKELCGRIDAPGVKSLGLVAEAILATFGARMDDAYGLLAEAMLPVLADEVPLDWAGVVYCNVLTLCDALADLPRMRAWMRSMQRWCEQSGSPATYDDICDVHRLQLRAATDDYGTLEERLLAVSTSLEDVNLWVASDGFYQLGEVRRLRGDDDGALAAFAKVRALGNDPQPGEALLRCRRGEPDRASTDLRLALTGPDPLARLRLLHAAVEVALARDCPAEADEYCRQLEVGAVAFDTSGFRAWAAHARGAILVYTSEPAEALEVLRCALSEYRNQQSRYGTAQVYEWMVLARRALGDIEVAATDQATAESIYRQLGVKPGLLGGDAVAPGGLTTREIDILTRIARGGSNRQVAEQTFISEKTVGRHLANIYAKLDVSSRTAAVAWAHANNALRAGD